MVSAKWCRFFFLLPPDNKTARGGERSALRVDRLANGRGGAVWHPVSHTATKAAKKGSGCRRIIERRVAPSSCLLGAPTDPDVPHSGIRLVRLQFRSVSVPTPSRTRGRSKPRKGERAGPMCGACRASSAIRCCRVDTRSESDASGMFPSNGSVTRCSPSLHRLLPGAVGLLRRYYESTPTPAAPPTRLADVGQYHGCICRFAPTGRRCSTGGPGGLGFGSPRADS